MTLSLSLVLACAWVAVAAVLAMIPSNDNHWRRAYGLIAVGLPLLVFVFYENGPWVGVLVLVAGMSFLRWPVRYLLRWIGRNIGLSRSGPVE